MIKVMFLQSLYGLVDVAMETELYSNIRFINFLDYPEYVPDARTIWLFRERIANNHKDKEIWKPIWKQFNEKGITVKKGTIQDATFIGPDPGHGKARKGDGTIPVDPEFPDKQAEQEKPETEMAKNEMKAAKRIEKESKKKERGDESRNAKLRRSKDGTWAVKNRKPHFWHKLQTGLCVENEMIHNYAVTTASVPDSQIDLGIPGIVNYREKGYKLPVESIRRNIRTTRKRSSGERPYSLIMTIFHGGHVFVTTIPGVRVKCMFMCLGHNLMRMIKMEEKGMTA